MDHESDASDRDHQHLHGIGGSPECVLCPVCVFLQALTSTRPEVTEHLLAAGRELTLALKAVVDAQVAAQGKAEERIQRIRVD